MSKNSLLDDIKVIRDFLINVQITEDYKTRGGEEELLKAIKSIGNLKGILEFHSVMLNSMRREIDSLYIDIKGDGEGEIG